MEKSIRKKQKVTREQNCEEADSEEAKSNQRTKPAKAGFYQKSLGTVLKSLGTVLKSLGTVLKSLDAVLKSLDAVLKSLDGGSE